MNELYKRTFAHVKMPEESVRALRASLVSRCSNYEMEVISMKKMVARRAVSFLVAALIAILPVSALACGVYYYVTYEMQENTDLPDDAIDLTNSDAEPLVFSDYAYQEEAGVILVEWPGEAVTYAATDDASAPDNATELAEQEAQFVGDSYDFTEADGTVIVHMKPVD